MSGEAAFTRPPIFFQIGSAGALICLEDTGVVLDGTPVYRARFVTRPADYADFPYEYRLTIATDGHLLWVRDAAADPIVGLGTMLGAALGND